jgi:hypothetical protein
MVDDVLEDAAETNGAENFWFLLSREVNALGVTASFNVENTGVRPNMFIITDKETVGIGGERCLSSPRKTEEKGDIAFLFAYIGRGVERKLAKFDWLEIML